MNHVLVFLSIFFSVEAVALAEVKVNFVGERFPMRLNVQMGESKETLTEAGTTKLTGKMTILPTALPTNGYYVVYRVEHGGKTTDVTVGPTDIDVKDGDSITVSQVGIVPPHNAALVPFKGGSILVSLMYPAAIENPADFSGSEEFRSSAMFVAKYGSRAVATKLAKDATTAGSKSWNHRNDQQISVIRESSAGVVIPSQAAATEEDLADAIHVGLIHLQLHGWGQEVKKAKDLLKK